EKGAERSRKMVEFLPDSALMYSFLTADYLNLDRLDDAQSTLERAAARKLDYPDFGIMRYDIAFLKGDAAAMRREADLARGNSAVEAWMSEREAFALAYTGLLRQARTMSERAVGMALHAGQREKAALYEIPTALWEGFFGNPLEAKRI